MIVCLDSVACTPDTKDLEFQYSVTWCRLMTKWNLVMKLSTIPISATSKPSSFDEHDTSFHD